MSVWASGAGDVWLMARDGAVLRSGDGITFTSVLEPDERQLGYLHGSAIEYRLFGRKSDSLGELLDRVFDASEEWDDQTPTLDCTGDLDRSFDDGQNGPTLPAECGGVRPRPGFRSSVPVCRPGSSGPVRPRPVMVL